MSAKPACFIPPDVLADLPNTQSALVFADAGPHAGLVPLYRLAAQPTRWECREIGGAGMWASEASEDDARATAARWAADGYQAEVVPLFELDAKAGGQS